VTSRYPSLSLALLLMLSGCRPEQAAEAPRGQPAPVTAARVETVALTPLRDTLDAVGTVRTKTRMLIASKVQGYVREVRVREGDRVEPGALLVTVDPRDLAARVDRARAALADAEMALDEVKTTQGEAEAALRAAEADHAYADATEARYRQLWQRDLITSPLR
jgi:multidrug efflux pump subunit AcrA (membrane-fusion protein)